MDEAAPLLIAPLLTGAVAFLLFLVKEIFDERRRKEETKWRYIAACEAANEELTYYHGVLGVALDQVDSNLQILTGAINGYLLCPSYKLMPSFLDDLRRAVYHYERRNPGISQALTSCFFELSHTASRLETLTTELSNLYAVTPQPVTGTTAPIQTAINNISGVKALIEATRKTFISSIALISTEVSARKFEMIENRRLVRGPI